jgi:hypothetical protein
VTTPLELVSDGAYRYMALPDDRDKLFSQSKEPNLLNVVTAPLQSCIVGDDWETLVEKLKYQKDKGQSSDFAPWLDLLPTLNDFQDMPRFWTSDRMDFVSKYDSGQLQARTNMDKLRWINHDPWALAVVDSRSNFLPDNTYAMTPLLDMFNHKADITTSARVDGANRFLLQIEKDSILLPTRAKQRGLTTQLREMLIPGSEGGGKDQNGSEVYVSYGSFDNMETLCNYGFIDENNTCNVETFRVRLRGKGPVYLVVDPDGCIDNIFNQLSLTDLRVALATAEEMDALEERELDGMAPISERNELEVFALIAGELDEALYDTEIGANEATYTENGDYDTEIGAGEATYTENGDVLVASYLRGRQRILNKGRDWLKSRYPKVY